MSNIYVISQMMSAKFAGNFFVSLLGTWEVSASILLKVCSSAFIIVDWYLGRKRYCCGKKLKEVWPHFMNSQYGSRTYCFCHNSSFNKFWSCYNSSFNKFWSTLYVSALVQHMSDSSSRGISYWKHCMHLAWWSYNTGAHLEKLGLFLSS